MRLALATAAFAAGLAALTLAVVYVATDAWLDHETDDELEGSEA